MYDFEEIKKEIFEERKEKYIILDNAQYLKKYTEEHKKTSVGSVNRLYNMSKKNYAGLESHIVTNPDIVRYYINDLMKVNNKKRLRTFATNECDLWFPMICPNPNTFIDKCYYVDIKSCFYRLYNIFGIDCCCELENKNNDLSLKFLAIGKINYKQLEDIGKHKELRNIVYGITKGGRFLMYKDKHWLYTENPKNPLQNSSIHNIILYVLHSIINEIQEHLIYWNIDGGFCFENGLEKILQIIGDYYMNCEYFEVTNLEIMGLGIYKSDNKSTLRHGVGSRLYNVYKTDLTDKQRIKKAIYLSINDTLI